VCHFPDRLPAILLNRPPTAHRGKLLLGVVNLPAATLTRNLDEPRWRPWRQSHAPAHVDKLLNRLDLRDDEFGSKLGAKVGGPEPAANYNRPP
jgi:hypothetical protein